MYLSVLSVCSRSCRLSVAKATMETRLSWRLLSGADNFSSCLPWRASEIYSWRCLKKKVRLVPPTTQERAQFRIARRQSPGSAMVTKHGGAAVASWGEGACRLAETRGDFLNRRHRASLIAAPSVIPVPTQRTAVNGQSLQAVLVCCVDVRRID